MNGSHGLNRLATNAWWIDLLLLAGSKQKDVKHVTDDWNLESYKIRTVVGS